ncbi:Ubiquinol cytochrome reductase transmembrane region [Ancylostoma ceylanicum]|uniref:Cytochrome b-c1 complex subunit Rieske, mitochondrial n=1 Tax=Ancylostoma ceylanicum TaxID=53326 RepID=A0A0D6LZF4_9BILA|nr:Ubiquinol cytochrome reductase transmembrane region [Ancylostoma ceylanicum]
MLRIERFFLAGGWAEGTKVISAMRREKYEDPIVIASGVLRRPSQSPKHMFIAVKSAISKLERMSTLARSGNLAKKVVTPIKDVVTDFKTADSLQAAASLSTKHGGLLSSNIATKGINVSSRRLAHTDVRFPDMSNYRRDVTLDIQKSARETEDERRSLSHAVYYGAGGVMSLWAGKEIVQTLVTEKAVNVSELRHAEHDDERVQKDEWSVVIGVCTHLGCVPIANAGDFGGYFCPCHGSHYDASGRIRKGPAPLNLHVPAYAFKENTIVIGSS